MKNKIIKIEGAIAHIDVSTRTHTSASTMVDYVDLDKVLDGGPRWRACSYRHDLYVVRTIRVKGRKVSQLLHRVISEVGAGELCDHKNRKTLDNRRENLRAATESQNRQNGNLIKHSSAFRGVSWHASKDRWRAVCLGRHVGYFREQESAAHAYDTACGKDPFAVLNFPHG